MTELKTFTCFFVFLLLLVPLSMGQEYEGTVTFTPEDLTIESVDGFDFIHLTEGVPHGAAGSPALPSVQRNVAIPLGAEVHEVKILSLETITLEGTYNVSPMTPPEKLQDIPMVEAPFIKDNKTYKQSVPLPGYYVKSLGTWDLVGQKFVKLSFNPVQYEPESGKLSLATEIRFIVSYNFNPDAELNTFNLTNSAKASYRSFMERNTLNPEAIAIPAFAGSQSTVLAAGQYEHVIITPTAFEQAWQDLVEWHTRKGYPDTVVTTDYIYANYAGADLQEKIRSFVADAHSTWGARFVLLGADGGDAVNEIPYRENLYNIENDWYDVPTDTFYADYNEDWVVDVHIGRVSVMDTAQIGQFINKVLHYEQTPPMSEYGNRVFFMGFDLDGVTRGEGSSLLLQNNELPAHISLETESDSESGSHLGDVITYLNSGPNLVNHMGHGNEYIWGMGYTNHNEALSQSDVEALTNGLKLINWYTLGCWANAWDVDTSISETFMRKVAGAGVSFTGNTRYGWYSPGYMDVYSALYDLRWWHVLFTDNQYHVGEALSAHKNDYMPDDRYYRYIFDELSLLGDPAMPLWMDNPAEMNVFFDDVAFTGEQDFSVTVEKSGGDLKDALVCLWKGEEVYQYETTDSDGEVTFNIDPLTAGTLLLTVTAQNCLPHQADVTIIEDAPPEVQVVSPDHGTIDGGTLCTLTGENFVPGETTVQFGSKPAQNVEVIDAFTLTCTTPAHSAALVDVTATTSRGSGAGMNAFGYNAVPTLSSISPTSGPIAGGTSVTLTGTDFSGGGTTTVTFGGSSATSVTVVNNTTVTCSTPAHSAGAVDVVLTNDDGSDTLTSGYTYHNSPNITSVSPANGVSAGGTSVTITGTDFTTSGTTTVSFGGTAATSVTVVSATSITCTTPSHTKGAVNVLVTNDYGSDTLTNGYTYHDAPSLTSVSPNNGPETGSTSVTLTGTDFTTVGTTTVTFGGTAATSVSVVNTTTITCTTPAHTPGQVDVVVTNDFGNDTLTNGYTYNNPPTVSAISPTDGPVTGATACTITGTYFTTSVDTSVSFGGTPATNVVVASATSLTCTAPAHTAGAVDVVVTNSNGSATLTAGYTYHNAPSITSLSPDNGPETGGTAVTITGTDFTTVGTTSVSFGGWAATSVTVVNATTITCNTPAHSPGLVSVVVTNNFGNDTLTNGFTYNNPPIVSSVSPINGPIAGGTTCTISGSWFTTSVDTTVTFGGTAATNVVVASANSLTCTSPAHVAGLVNITVTNSNGSDTLTSAFTYHNQPSVTSVSPNNGPEIGATAVTISGTDFTTVGTTSVSFGGTAATGVSVVNSTTITCTTPAHVPGQVDVVVTNDFGFGTLTNGFTYNNPPTLSAISPTDGVVAGGASCTITGTYFTTSPDTTVTFGGSSATNLVVVNATTLTCNTPAHAAGIVNVVLTNSNGSDTLSSAYTFHNPPVISSISPDNGPEIGGTAVTLTGTDYTNVGTTSVTFGGFAASGVTVVNATTINCNAPAHSPGVVDVVVTNDFGIDTATNGYTYNNPPIVSSISPTDGLTAGGETCTISGNYFTTSPDTTVKFGATSATNVTVVSANSLTCTAPAHIAGTVDITVTNSNGTDTLSAAYTYHSPPTISSVSPNSGPTTGGTAIVLSGTNFTAVGSTTVTFGGTAATGVTVVNTTTINCTTPAHAAGVVNVVITNDFGTDTLTSGYTFALPPTVTGVSPANGKIVGGTTCTVTGTNFTTTVDTTVTFDGLNATNVNVLNSTTLTCTNPAHIAGSVDVTVTNSNGFGTLTAGFTYHNAPTLTAISPDNGPETGGTAVTLTGTDFTTVGSTSVTIGGWPASSVVVVNTTTITCTTPAHTPGLVSIVVTNDFGTDTLVNGYTYNSPPSLSGISPTDGPVGGGTACTITGANFTTTFDTTVTFGGTAASNLVVVDANTVTCTAPAHAAGPVNIVLTNSNGSDSLSSAFTYHNAPSLISVSPSSGPETGGTSVTLTGNYFTTVGTTLVTFGGTAASSVNVVNSTTITCTTPAHAPGVVNVSVANDFGSDVLTSGYTYNNLPVISGISPIHGPVAGGTACTISGNYFTTSIDTTISFGGTNASNVTVVNSTTITCNAPAHSAGLVDVVITNSNGSDTLTSAFTYHNAPSVTGISPSNGPQTGGTAVTLTGTDFTTVGSTSVSIGGTAATGVTVVNATTINCTTPAHSPGLVNVVVTNDFGSDTLVSGYTYNNPPSIFSVLPTDGTVSGSTSVTITGSGFTTTPDTTVVFDVSSASSVVVVNSTTITCNTPAHGAGTINVTVSNSNGSDVKVNAYTYHNPPTLLSVTPNNGPQAGNSAVTLTGTDFTPVGTTTVTFGGNAATAVSVVNSTTITCTTPSHAPGAVNVVVTNDFGNDTLVSGYTYNTSPPLLSGISPEFGTVLGGESCTITGGGFTTSGDTNITFDTTPATNVVVVDTSTVTCDSPAHGLGAVDITLSNSNGSDTLTSAFTYYGVPSLSSISPNNGPQTGGTAVTLTGTNFNTVGTTVVTFDGLAATNLVIVNSTTITCDTPAHLPGTVDVVLTHDLGSDTLVNGFTFNVIPPTIVSVNPAHGSIVGGTAVTIVGGGFTTTIDTTVTFGGTVATNMVVVDAATITCDAPAHAAGSVDVAVTNSNGSDTAVNGFTYHNAPSITSIAPTSGSLGGGTPVTITGTDFTPMGTQLVDFGANPATNVVVVNSTTMTCTTPAGTVGLVDLTVTNDFGTDTLVNAFTYLNLPGVLKVPGDYATIQAAINAAAFNNSDTILVAPGTYEENIDFLGKAITVRSDTDANNATYNTAAFDTVIDGMQSGSCVSFTNGEGATSVLEGFTLTNGSGTVKGPGTNGGGIFAEASSPVIIGNVIAYNACQVNGGGLAFFSCTSTVRLFNNIINDNTSFSGGGIFARSSKLVLTNNSIIHNIANSNGGNMYTDQFSTTTVTNTILSAGVASTGTEVYIGTAGSPSAFTISYSNVNGGLATFAFAAGNDPTWGAGMIETAPSFVDTFGRDFHLTKDADCVDAGNNGVVFKPFDIDGDARISAGLGASQPIAGKKGAFPINATLTVDIGADELYDLKVTPLNPGLTVQ